MEFKSAIDATCDRGGQFGGTNNVYKVEHFKTEWLNADGTVGSTANLL